MELNSSPVMESSQRFSTDSSAHFGPDHYPFPHTNGRFSIDQNIDIGEGYASNTASNITSRVNSGGEIVSRSESLTNESSHAAATSTAQRSNSTLDNRRGSYDAQDIGLFGGDSKRKRSKVSRACDQCRRKKVRCDADTDGGPLKTCSHCLKAGQTCDFSRVPQKRGPSKGYIKELSERVQQVEGQLALQYSPGVRSSLDGSGTGAFGDHSFSPEEDDNLRRPSSFSLPRNPFADFNRDRMPSIGGWNITSNPQPSRDRDRTSIAIPPDQHYPHLLQHQNKHFWAEFSESPTKRRRLSHEDAQAIEFTQSDLSTYYENIHPNFPILADTTTTLAVLHDASPTYQHAFNDSLKPLRASKSLSNTNSKESDPAMSDTIVIQKSTEDFLNAQSTELSTSRSDADNLVLMWTATLQSIICDADILRWKQGLMSKTRALMLSIELIKDYLRSYELRNEQQRDLKSHWFRGWHCVTLLLRLHALGLGGEDPSSETRFLHILTRPKESLPPNTAYLAYAAGYLDRIADLNAEVLYDPSASRTLDKLRLQAHLHELSDILDVSDHDTLIREMNQFIRLLIIRVGSPSSSPDISASISSLVATLHIRTTSNNQNTTIWDPLSVHVFVLSTLTLLEVTLADHQSSEENTHTLKLLKESLKYTKERHHFADPDAEVATTKRYRLHWADALLQMIEAKTHGVEKEMNGTDSMTGVSSAIRTALDFGLLVRRGYLNVLIEYANKLNSEPT